MKLAAIDIGSNAIRLQIVKVFEEKEIVSFKKLQFLRFPLRLGKDVFNDGKISFETQNKFIKLMDTFKNLMELYEVDGYTAVATSAMREAKNGSDLIKIITEKIKLDINIIDGVTEARIINKALIPYLNNDAHMHIDVGGGSTELNYYIGKTLQASHSFKIGSVRKLSSKKRTQTFKKIKQWINRIELDSTLNISGIGTGGNINKLFKISNKTNGNTISLTELKGLRAYVRAFSLEERKSILKMNTDRADVIIPASKIYINVLRYINSDHIIVPQVGLKDGLIYELYEKIANRRLSKFAYI